MPHRGRRPVGNDLHVGLRSAHTGARRKRRPGHRARRRHRWLAPRRPRCRAAELAHLRARLRRAEVLSSRPDQGRQHRRARPGVALGDRLPARPRGDAADRRRRHVRHLDLEQSARARRRDRARDLDLRPQGVEREVGAASLLRRGQPRRRAVGRQGLRRSARRAAGRARRRDRRAGLGGPDHGPRAPLHHHRRSPCGQGKGSHRQRRRRVWSPLVRHRLRRGKRRAGLALLHRPREPGRAVRASRARDGGQDLDRGVVASRRRRHRLGLDGLRSRARPALRRRRQRRPLDALSPQPRRRRQSLPVLDPRPASGHRRARVALPDDTGRQLGLHLGPAHPARGPRDRRASAQGAAARPEERLLLRPRPRDRRAASRPSPTCPSPGRATSTSRPGGRWRPRRATTTSSRASSRPPPPVATTGIRCPTAH